MPGHQPIPSRVLHLWPDDDTPVPLFGEDRTRPLTGDDLGLSAGLQARIDTWQALFETEHRGHDGWRSADAARTYARESRGIVDGLVAELPGFVIEYSLWPVGERGYAGGWATGWSPSGATPLAAGTEVRQFDVASERWIRLMNDYSGPPLWATYGGIGPEHLDLPDGLGRELDAWQAGFDRDFHWDTGWRTDDLAAHHTAEGRRLLPLVAAELPGHVIELITGDVRAYAGAWVDGWLPVLPDVHFTPWSE
ncbi:hypothetical protein FK268_10255 [Tsukamurella sputi]|uniref:Uncharacterized protein n=1 Tax=Tsukamurella sputi TaxID=2591848 RepID=A0A5C5RPK2_9ACTN|nr:hypothetical protein [Tsukamurella sputi]TWS24015.1 hypothetical protein FK268_10255 [Tsukamurella sputi]